MSVLLSCSFIRYPFIRMMLMGANLAYCIEQKRNTYEIPLAIICVYSYSGYHLYQNRHSIGSVLWTKEKPEQ